jgi:hypothetical protein
MNRVVGGKISKSKKSKKLYGGGITEEQYNTFIQGISEEFEYQGSYEYDIGDTPINFLFDGEFVETVARLLLVEDKTPAEIFQELRNTEDAVYTNYQLIMDYYGSDPRPEGGPPETRDDVPVSPLHIYIVIYIIIRYISMTGSINLSEAEQERFIEYRNEGRRIISEIEDEYNELNPEGDDEEQAMEESLQNQQLMNRMREILAQPDDPSSRPPSRPASRRSSMARDPENRRVRRPSDLMWFEESPAPSRAPSRPASRRPSRVIPDTDPEGVSESIYGFDDPRPVGYGKNKNKKSIINKKTMSERIVGAGKMSAMEKKLMGMGMSGGQIKKLMKMGMLEKGKGMSGGMKHGAGVLSIQHGGRKMKKIMEEDEEEMSEEEMEEEKPMKGGRVAIDPFFGVISSEGGARNYAHPESFSDRRYQSKLSFGSGYSDKHDKSAIEEDKALEMKEAVRRAGTEGRRELDRKMSAPAMSFGMGRGEMEGGFFGSLISAAIPLIGSLFGRGMMTKEAHDELMKTMKMKEKKGGMKHGGSKKLLGRTRMEMEDEKLGEGMSGGRKPNAFIAFSNKHRSKVRAQMKDAPMKEVMKKLGEMYRAQK